MRFLLGFLLGYSMRGKKRLLIATLIAIAVVCFIVLPAIALSLLAIDVRRERLGTVVGVTMSGQDPRKKKSSP